MKTKAILKTTLLRLISLTFGLLIGLLLAEIFCRFYSFGWEAFAFRKVHSFTAIGYSGFIRPADDQYVWYELKPNVDDYFKMKPIKTNSRGLRDKEYPFEKPPGTYRVAVIGDSFTFGDGVHADEVYHAILEERLNRLSDSLRFEFINFGLAAYDLLNYYGVIRAKAMAYDPDLILVGFCGNNDDDLPEARQWTEPFTRYKYAGYSWFIQHFQIIRTVANNISIQRRKETAVKDRKLEKKTEFVTEMFARFNEVQQECQVPFMVYYLSMADAPPEKAGLIASLCDTNDFMFVDSSPAINSIEDISRYWFHKTDRHPNAAMHNIYADILMRYFARIKEPLPFCP
jgi:GDSL-like Lipase/Acylhydrolase family